MAKLPAFFSAFRNNCMFKINRVAFQKWKLSTPFVIMLDRGHPENI
jgi:hypothetical protein